ncbi:MAG: endonuclease/exonuclease/phosphatase family protein [Verrucomicrobiota bacterium JB023]|nr:endonuclease/exonuclease/phosphatase family protein [Verrucomicrobiota bacterium JB023]
MRFNGVLTLRLVTRRTILGLALIGLIIGMVLTLLTILARQHWFCEIITHFRFQILGGLVGVSLLLLLIRRWKLLPLVLLLAVPHLIAIAPQIVPGPKVAAAGPSLRLISYNVLTSNETPQEAVNWVLEQDADLVLLLEIGFSWHGHLQPLDEHYPYKVSHPRGDNFGLAFYSKLPITEKTIDTKTHPFLYAKVDWQGRPLAIAGVHPIPPLGRTNARDRDNTFDKITRLAAVEEAPLIVAGDFNCTPWSPAFQPMLENLHDTSRGTGYSPTWRRFHPLYGIPIDHLLLSDSLVCLHREIGPRNGSDHSPIVAEIASQAQ